MKPDFVVMLVGSATGAFDNYTGICVDFHVQVVAKELMRKEVEEKISANAAREAEDKEVRLASSSLFRDLQRTCDFLSRVRC